MENENEDGAHKKGRQRKKQLYNTILQQMEFYFSDSNLSKDRFLSQLIQENPYVDLAEFLKFNKIRKLTTNLDDIKKSIRKSTFLELSEDKEKIRRLTDVKVRENVDNCTIYVERISSDATHESLSSIFSDFGTVAYVSIPKYKHNHMNKGFAFVEFDTENEAQNAVNYFESIGSKMSSNINPKDLCSVTSFIIENQMNLCENSEDKSESENKTTKKRKHSIDDEEDNCKKTKIEEFIKPEENVQNEDSDGKRKKKKDHKRKNLIKELGLQVLSKQEWKKMRNGYLNLQRKKMSDIKKHLHKVRYNKMNLNEKNLQEVESSNSNENKEEKPSKLETVPGTIVKLKLQDPCQSDKKLRMEIKASSKDVKYVDIPFGAGTEEVFVRFLTPEAAKKFCTEESHGTKILLEGEEEQEYWKKIDDSRTTKFQKSKKKERGKEKLLRKAEKHLAQHTRFDDE